MGVCASALDDTMDELNGIDTFKLKEDAVRVFKLIDADGNGTISTEEFEASPSWKKMLSGKKAPKTPSNPDLKTFVLFIKSLEPEGAIMMLEFMEKELVWAPIEKKAIELFEMLDTDKSGSIDLKKEGGDLNDFGGRMVLEDMDLDNSGDVSLKEFIRAIKRKCQKSYAMTGLLIDSSIGHLKAARNVKA